VVNSSPAELQFAVIARCDMKRMKASASALATVLAKTPVS